MFFFRNLIFFRSCIEANSTIFTIFAQNFTQS